MPGTEPDIIVRRRHPGRWVAAILLLFALGWLVDAFARAPAIHWDRVGAYLFEPTIMQGLLITILLAILCQIGAMIVGVLVAVMRLSSNPVLSSFAAFYIWFFRGVPILVQLIFIYNLALVFPVLGIGIPFTPLWITGDTNLLINGFTAAVIGLSLADGAQVAEIVRAGILSVPHGQKEAAQALGFGPGRTFRRIVLPQAMRFIIPPTGNNFIQMLKATSLVSVIAGHDLLTAAQNISARTYEVIELLLVATAWYLLLVSIATLGQSRLERHFARGAR
jgi:polar amino acid transport system permease protein